MKKIFRHSLLAAVALTAFFAISCSNNDIEIARTNKTTLAVTTQQAYDQLGITSDIINALGDEPQMRIGLTLFFYDGQGKLARKEILTSRTFVTHTVELEKMDIGTYTVVAVETITESNGESRYWKYTGEQQLSTLRLDKRYESYIRWPGAVALYTGKVSVGGSTTTNTITPTPIGFLLQCSYEGIARMGVTEMLVNIKNESQGIWLAPNHDNATKLYYEDYNKKDEWTPIAGFPISEFESLKERDVDVFFVIETGQNDCLLALIDPKDPKHRPEEGYTNFTYEYPSEEGVSINFQTSKIYGATISYNPSTGKEKYYIGISN